MPAIAVWHRSRMPPPEKREPTSLADLLGYGSSLTRSDFYRLTRHMAVRMSDLDTPDAEMRLIRMVVKALDEIAERWRETLEQDPPG